MKHFVNMKNASVQVVFLQHGCQCPPVGSVMLKERHWEFFFDLEGSEHLFFFKFSKIIQYWIQKEISEKYLKLCGGNYQTFLHSFSNFLCYQIQQVDFSFIQSEQTFTGTNFIQDSSYLDFRSAPWFHKLVLFRAALLL